MNISLEDIYALSHLDMVAKQIVEGFITGLHKSPFHGFSVEFAEHRQYNTGESTRHIDWKVYSKTDKLFVKKYDEETNLRAFLLTDVSASMYYPEKKFSKLVYAKIATASLAYLLQKQRDAVGLGLYDGQALEETAIKTTRTHLDTIIKRLESLPDTPSTSRLQAAHKATLAQCMHHLADRLHSRSMVIILSDLLEIQGHVAEFMDAVHHLKYNKHEVLILHLKESKTEFSFQFDPRPTTFIDLETGNKVKLNPKDLQALYTQEMIKFGAQLKLKCAQYKVDYLELDTDTPLQQLLGAFVASRAKTAKKR